MTSEQEAERQRELQRITNAYHRVFKSEDGAMVLRNLRAYFRVDRPAFERTLHHPYDPIGAALRDGQREVILFIDHKLAAPVEGDANLPDTKTRIIKP